jgi:hypothetical protein
LRKANQKSFQVQTAPIDSVILKVDSTPKFRIDTAKISIPIAEFKNTKLKKRVFQKDFEGLITTTDSSHQKTAAKGFHIQWRSGRDKEAALEQPRIRLTQNF